MIVYLAAYPRSGNSLLQHWVRSGFHHLTSQVRSNIKSTQAAFEKLKSNARKFELVRADKPVLGWEEKVVWNDYLALYRRGKQGPWRRALVPLPLAELTEDLRQSLASEKNIFFLKTHNLPFDSYFDGEYVVQSVRHPGAVHWSYFRHQNDFIVPRRNGPSLFMSPPPTLDHVILGHTNFGSWSTYQQAWRKAAEGLGPRFLSVAFEELVADQLGVLERIGEMLGLVPLARDLVSFEAFKSRFPGKDLRGKSEGYEGYYSRRQLQLMWEMHGPVATEYGYAAPDLDRACPDEQIHRLEEMIAAAWASHAQVKKAYGDALRDARQRAHAAAVHAPAPRKRT